MKFIAVGGKLINLDLVTVINCNMPPVRGEYVIKYSFGNTGYFDSFYSSHEEREEAARALKRHIDQMNKE